MLPKHVSILNTGCIKRRQSTRWLDLIKIQGIVPHLFLFMLRTLCWRPSLLPGFPGLSVLFKANTKFCMQAAAREGGQYLLIKCNHCYQSDLKTWGKYKILKLDLQLIRFGKNRINLVLGQGRSWKKRLFRAYAGILSQTKKLNSKLSCRATSCMWLRELFSISAHFWQASFAELCSQAGNGKKKSLLFRQ